MEHKKTNQKNKADEIPIWMTKRNICYKCKNHNIPIKEEPCKSCTWMHTRRPTNFSKRKED